MTEAVRRRIATAVPFVLSLGLSLSTVGRTLHWQDSGFFLSAVRELGVLYPPGYVLYVLLAKLWSVLFFFLDFTLAVHLFSSVCAALAAAVMGRSVAALLRSRGKLFRVTSEDPGPLPDAVGAAIGCLAACGYTFWFSATYAKGYALFYLVVALLLRGMIRADESGRPRDFTVVAALIGLAWQAHPSAALTGLALALFVGMHARSLGWKGLAWRSGLAAAAAAGPLLLLPLLARGDPASAFGDPRSVSDLLEYATGERFVGRPDSFGWEPTRFWSVFRYGWEEFLGVGTALVVTGAGVMALRHRRLLGWILLAWVVPVLEVTLIFLIEGQHDFWFVGAWLPLYLVAGVGLYEVSRRTAARVSWVAGAAGVAWALLANHGDLNLRNYRLAEEFARGHLEGLEDDAILLVLGDDAAAGVHYLQGVRGEKRGVTLVRAGHLERGRSGGPSWYDRKLLRRDPTLTLPDYAAARGRIGAEVGLGASIAAFLAANAGTGRPIYMAFRMPQEGLPDGFVLSPAGGLWKMTRWPEAPDPRHWAFASRAEEVAGQFRRPRGQRSAVIEHVDRLVPEPYERRLLQLMLDARRKLADWHHDHGGWREAATLYDSIAALDPEVDGDALLSFRRGESHLRGGREDRGEKLLERGLNLGLGPAERASAHAHLARICRERGDEAGVRLHLQGTESVRTPPDDVQERLARLRGLR